MLSRADFDPIQRRIFALTQELVVVGVTGTKGKTTTASLIGHLLNVARVPAACTTTVDTTIPGEQPWPSCQTQSMLLALLTRTQKLGIRHLVVETPSYSLAHDLADVCVFSGAVFTNLGHEHLHIHGDRATYMQAKRRLFASLGRRGSGAAWAAINGDDQAHADMVRGLAARVDVLRYGLTRQGFRVRKLDFYAVSRQYSRRGACYHVVSPERIRVPIRTRLPGEFNVYNALAAITAAYCLDLTPEQIQVGLATFVAPPGRFEVAGGDRGRPLVVVDYAHTPESLNQVLLAARRLVRTRGRLWTVFGCGGETDASKRPLMGQVAADLSDRILLTSDNPRREDPAAIIAAILAGCPSGPAHILIEMDRRRAIAHAIREAGAADVIVIAGRGHETEQILADRKVPFSDREYVYELLSS